MPSLHAARSVGSAFAKTQSDRYCVALVKSQTRSSGGFDTASQLAKRICSICPICPIIHVADWSPSLPAESTTASFLSLPRELRDKVYAFAFPPEDHTITLEYPLSPVNGRPRLRYSVTTETL